MERKSQNRFLIKLLETRLSVYCSQLSNIRDLHSKQKVCTIYLSIIVSHVSFKVIAQIEAQYINGKATYFKSDST